MEYFISNIIWLPKEKYYLINFEFVSSYQKKLFLMLHKEIGPTILWYEGNLSNNIQCIN